MPFFSIPRDITYTYSTDTVCFANKSQSPGYFSQIDYKETKFQAIALFYGSI